MTMAEKGEKLFSPLGGNDSQDGGDDKERGVAIECAVCLQTCVYPVQLPCKHIFCFLCVKGVSLQSKRCAMCRRDVPQDFLQNPELLSQLDMAREEVGYEDGGQWFYEGRNGWWLYDERTSQEIESFWSQGEKHCELLIAGLLYIIDFEQMLQYRRNDPSRRRRIKRDVASGPKKGIAGIRIAIEGSEETAIADNLEASDDTPDEDSVTVVSVDPEEEEDGDNELHSAMESLSVSERGVVTRVQLNVDSDEGSSGTQGLQRRLQVSSRSLSENMIDSGSRQQIQVNSGSQPSPVNSGSQQSVVNSGSQLSHVNSGSQQSHVNSGSQQSRVSSGSQQSRDRVNSESHRIHSTSGSREIQSTSGSHLGTDNLEGHQDVGEAEEQ